MKMWNSRCVGKLPEKLYIEAVDICGVLANALENAMEASLGSKIKQCVSMKTGCYENIVTFQIKNTYDSEKYAELSKGQFATSKNEDGHGYGISNMYRIAKQYAGRIEYTVEKRLRNRRHLFTAEWSGWNDVTVQNKNRRFRTNILLFLYYFVCLIYRTK